MAEGTTGAAVGPTPIVNMCRAALRIPDDVTLFDHEISDLVDAARSALIAGGVSSAKAGSDDDASVRVAIKVYVKANFGMDNPDSEKLMQSFTDMLTRMAGQTGYRDEGATS